MPTPKGCYSVRSFCAGLNCEAKSLKWESQSWHQCRLYLPWRVLWPDHDVYPYTSHVVHLKDVSQALAASLLKASSISAVYTLDQMEVPSPKCLWEPFHTLVTTLGPFESFLKALKKPILVMIFFRTSKLVSWSCKDRNKKALALDLIGMPCKQAWYPLNQWLGKWPGYWWGILPARSLLVPSPVGYNSYSFQQPA